VVSTPRHEIATVVAASASNTAASTPAPAEEPKPVAVQPTPAASGNPAPSPLAPPVLPSGLMQVETDPGKQHSAAESSPAAETAPVRPRRPRRATAPVSSEPLVQVETHKHEETAE
jgi:ribonuclease E